MSNPDYMTISDGELVERLEKSEMQTDPDLCREFMRRMQEKGTLYNNTPEDEQRWKADLAASAQKDSQ